MARQRRRSSAGSEPAAALDPTRTASAAKAPGPRRTRRAAPSSRRNRRSERGPAVDRATVGRGVRLPVRAHLPGRPHQDQRRPGQLNLDWLHLGRLHLGWLHLGWLHLGWLHLGWLHLGWLHLGRLRLIRRLLGLLGPSADGARQSMVALVLNSATSLVAGAVLGSITGTFERLPGLLVLVPAAIGLRGNVFSSLGNRLSTAIHVGTFRLSLRPQTVMGQNVAASLVLTLSLSLVLAVVAKVVAVALGVMNTISVLDLALISILGGLLASLVVLVATVALAAGSVRFGWDLDNVTAPLVSTVGDVLTLPALFIASLLVTGVDPAAGALGATLGALSLVFLVAAWRSRRDVLRQVVRESTPILVTAACLSTMAGIAIEKQLGVFSTFPALLMLFPAFISSAGALGGILSSRLSTKLHLGLMAPDPFPSREARLDGAMVLLLGAPVYLLNGVGAHLVGTALGKSSPGLPQMVAVSLVGGLGAVLFVVAVAYYGTIAAFRFGVDPDTYGIPVVTSSVDFVGAICLILAIVALGIT